MATGRRKGIVLQDRDRHLLREVSLFRAIDREQAKLIAGFTSTTRANARLLALHRAGLLKRFFLGTTGAGQKAIYSISRKGALLIGVPYRGLQRRNDESLATDFFVHHQLAVNGVYACLRYNPIPVPGVEIKRWVHFFKPIVPEIRLIPDGYVEFESPSGTVACFLEIDRGTETLDTWTTKVGNYLQLAVSGTFRRIFKEPGFDVLVVGNSERRVQSIRSATAPLTAKMFWFATFVDIEGPRFFGPAWLRPKGDERVPLFENLP